LESLAAAELQFAFKGPAAGLLRDIVALVVGKGRSYYCCQAACLSFSFLSFISAVEGGAALM